VMVKDIFEDSDDTYGYRRIQAILKRRGVRADGATSRSLMRGRPKHRPSRGPG